MAKEVSLRNYSHCGNGHNSRACNKEIKLFGVKINVPGDDEKYANAKAPDIESLRKCKSLGSLRACNLYNDENTSDFIADAGGYLSDGLLHESSQSKTRPLKNKRKGNPWSEEEHRCFLFGLEKLGKGDWKGISKNFVLSRTPTQVASHAQKYFQRMSATERRKRRPSVFDMPMKQTNSNAQVSPAPIACTSTQGSITMLVNGYERPPLSPTATNSDMIRRRLMFGARNVGHVTPMSSNIPVVPMWSFSNQIFGGGHPNVTAFYNRFSSAMEAQHSGVFSYCPTRVAASKDGIDLGVEALTL